MSIVLGKIEAQLIVELKKDGKYFHLYSVRFAEKGCKKLILLRKFIDYFVKL